MGGVAEDANENVLGGDVQVKAARYHKPNQTDAICDFLDQGAGGSERGVSDPFSAVGIYDECEGKVGGLYDGHAEVDGLVVVTGVLTSAARQLSETKRNLTRRTFISLMTGKKAEVPAEDTKIVAVAVIPTMNDGYAIA